MDKITTLESPELDELIKKYSPFFAEIRKRIFVTVLVFSFSTLLGFIFYEKIIKFLIDILKLQGINIVFTSPFQFINLAISCGVFTGVVIVFPLVIYQLMSFLKPALKPREYKMVAGFLPFSIILFLLGFISGFVVMKWQIQMFLSTSVSLGIGNILDITRLLSTVLLTAILLGLGFQFPIILFCLLRLGVIRSEQLTRQRMWVYLGSFLFSILLPADSILADIIITIPLILMFELTIFLHRIFEKKKIAITT